MVVFSKRFNGYIVAVEEVRTGRKELATTALRKYDRGSEKLPSRPSLHTPEATLPRKESIGADVEKDNNESQPLKSVIGESNSNALVNALPFSTLPERLEFNLSVKSAYQVFEKEILGRKIQTPIGLDFTANQGHSFSLVAGSVPGQQKVLSKVIRLLRQP